MFIKGEKKQKCSSFSAPPYPPHGVELTGAESLQSPTLTGPPARGASDIDKFLSKSVCIEKNEF